MKLPKDIECQTCKGEIKGKGKKFCSHVCYWKSLNGLKNDKAPNWRGNNVHKVTIHDWLNNNYGKPSICEGENCRENTDFYEWCLKKGKKHERKRGNYLRLCRSCHRLYDMTEEKWQRWRTINMGRRKYA